MKVILEKVDLLKILSKEFGYDLEDDDVTVSMDPFEVQVSQLPVQQLAARNSSKPEEEVVVTDLPELPELPEQEDKTVTTMTMEQLLAHSDELAHSKKSNESGFKSDDAPISRPLGPDEFEEPPPVSPAEISGGLEALNRLAEGN